MLILAADDQSMILKLIEYKLLEVGFEVISASDGQEAIDFFDSYHPDLAIIDINMPVKSGYEVVDHIRNVRSSNIPIIVMSCEDEEPTIVSVFIMGVDDYIKKPVRVNEVIVRVKRLLNIKINSNKLYKNGVIKSGLLIKNGIGIVIPCYNEEKRLKTKEFANFIHNNHGYHICFVNDGSNDKTLEVLKDFQLGKEDYISIYNCEKNGGKGEAVRQGIIYLLKDKSIDYIGFLDADLSTDFADFDDLAKTLSSSDFKLVAGSRIHRMGANIIQQSSRGIISKIINKIIQTILGMEIQDTQCGAKIMRREVAENMFNTPFVTRWLFDVEIFLRMKIYYGAETVEKLICEQPLKRWVHEDGSKLSFKDSIKILGQLAEIARKYKNIKYMEVIELDEDFTTERALAYKEKLNEYAKKYSVMTIDARKVNNADIVGVNALATTQKIIEDKGGKLIVRLNKDSELFRLLHLTKFSTIILLEF